MGGHRPNLAVVVVVSVCTVAFGLAFQALGNWAFRGSPSLTYDEVARTAILCVVVSVTALFVGARARR